MARFRIAQKAKNDLRSIWNYTYDTGSKKQADKYLKDLMSEFATIVRCPKQGRNDKEIVPEFFGVKKNKHITFYRILDSGAVEIIRILHESMDLPSRISD